MRSAASGLIATLCLAGGLVLTAVDVSAAEPPPWLTGTALHKAWEQPIGLVQERVKLRDLLSRLAEARRTACVLDRRIDPSLPISLAGPQDSLRSAFDEVARQAQARCSPLGGTLLIGRTADLDRLLSQSESLQTAMKSDRAIPAARRLRLARPFTVAWDDLDRPVDVLARIEGQWELQVVNPQVVPHDLWAGGAAAGVDAVQALSLVLGQFHLSFRWVTPGETVEIVPLPEQVRVERTHRPQKLTTTQAVEAIQSDWPGAVAKPRSGSLVVTATVLEHEEIADRLSGVRKAAGTNTNEPPPLSRRRFPVRIVRNPLSAVLRALQAQGIEIEYDAAQLAAAGVNLETPVSLEFENATADEFFSALCAPAGLTYEIDGAKVILKPRRD